mmetsp:Transcript_71511/g.219078  ORF Transcript_71511/g.219078 Transcript_71511/m.219078 type:complete len:85 (+) Transcript_71511:102-356(+)
MACPFRMFVTLLAALGLASILGPAAASAAGCGRPNLAGKHLSRRAAVWLGTAAVVALHADLLLSLGYTRCAFQYVAGLHRLLVS